MVKARALEASATRDCGIFCQARRAGFAGTKIVGFRDSTRISGPSCCRSASEATVHLRMRRELGQAGGFWRVPDRYRVDRHRIGGSTRRWYAVHFKNVLLTRCMASVANEDADDGTSFKSMIEEAQLASSGRLGAPRPEDRGRGATSGTT